MRDDNSGGLENALFADGPNPGLGDQLGLYGQFVGDWHAEVVAHALDGSVHRGRGEIRFGWILEGRAIQDVWTIPPIGEKKAETPPFPVTGDWYGTTIRSWDPALSAWRIFWIDPATNTYRQQTGRKAGNDIIQEGSTETGMLSRWTYTDITPDAFRWKAEGSQDGGRTWHLFVEVLARRTSRHDARDAV